VTLIALPLIFEQMHQAGKLPSEAVGIELFENVKIYNPIPGGEEEAYTTMLVNEYATYCQEVLAHE